jgi:hypothetical protein
MSMFCNIVTRGLGKVNRTYFYLENKNGVGLQGVDQEPKPTQITIVFANMRGHVFTKCPFIEKGAWDA